jgi:hypothetical protein
VGAASHLSLVAAKLALGGSLRIGTIGDLESNDK